MRGAIQAASAGSVIPGISSVNVPANGKRQPSPFFLTFSS
jgi:hypothetical protein